MRIIKESVLRQFFETYSDSEEHLRVWITVVRKADFDNPHQVKKVFSSADQVANKPMVFNICRNKYRLIIMFLYDKQRAYIRFIGTHEQYDKIKNIQTI